MDEKEPKRYYDWMLWKMRQLDKEEKELKDKIGLDILQEVVIVNNNVGAVK